MFIIYDYARFTSEMQGYLNNILQFNSINLHIEMKDKKPYVHFNRGIIKFLRTFNT